MKKAAPEKPASRPVKPPLKKPVKKETSHMAEAVHTHKHPAHEETPEEQEHEPKPPVTPVPQPIPAPPAPKKLTGKERDQAVHDFLLWLRDWAKFNDLGVRNRVLKLLADIGEPE